MCKLSHKYTTSMTKLVYYPILAQSQSICYVYQATMMVDHCTPKEQNPLIHLQHINTCKNYEIMDINATFRYRAKIYFYVPQVPVVVDHCTKYEQNQCILF